MRLAERFRLPVVTLVDTAGAYPGVQAEERGQAAAIARAIDCCLDLRVPLVSAIVGEGGSGGAVALAAANRVVMRSEARRVGNECVSTCRFRWSTFHSKTTTIYTYNMTFLISPIHQPS